LPHNEPGSATPQFYGHEGAEIRGDKIYLSARKLGKISLVRRSAQHHAQEITADKDARAKLLRAYTSTRGAR
jgi:hypothetical protein